MKHNRQSSGANCSQTTGWLRQQIATGGGGGYCTSADEGNSGGGGGVATVVGVGAKKGGVLQTIRTALHTISISLQNSFCESHTWRLVIWKARRALKCPLGSTCLSRFWGRKVKWVRGKIAWKRPTGPIIIATNFLWEQKTNCWSVSNIKEKK